MNRRARPSSPVPLTPGAERAVSRSTASGGAASGGAVFGGAFVSGTLLIDAVRCWRGARDSGRAVQPSLFRLLSRLGCEMLAPVLDSFFLLCETALGRRFVVGRAAVFSDDEILLVRLIEGSMSRKACIQCPVSAATALDCAICSTRIMMRLALPPLS